MHLEESRSVVERYGDLVYRIAYARMHSREDAEDIFQEVFLTYVRKQPRFGQEYQARAWFSKVTVNHCRLLWRTKQRHAAVPLDEAEAVPAPDMPQTDNNGITNPLGYIVEDAESGLFTAYLGGVLPAITPVEEMESIVLNGVAYPVG